MSDRSFERITKADLKKLARLARSERDDFFGRHKEWAILYRKRVMCSVLCKGAALHYLNGATGVSEFNVWTFYAAHPEAPFPFQHVAKLDFGKSRFGQDPVSPEAYEGRRVELQGRSLDCKPGDDPVEILQRYLKAGDTPSARELREQAVVLLEPGQYCGYAVWPSLAVSVS